MRKLFLTASLLLLALSSNAQLAGYRIDSLVLSVLKDPAGPGGAFMVAHKGKPVYKKAFGTANLELEARMGTANVFQIGSMTKQFTAIAILILEEQGKLSVLDPVSKYLPSYPNGSNITLHQLLTHTSGIKDFTKMKALQDIAQKEMAPAQLVDFFKNEPADFAPGTRFDYNNSGYVVLGHLIELVSGSSYEDFIKTHLFDKAGMPHSFYASDRKIIKDRAYGYHKKSHGYVNKTAINFSVPFASGALMSTLDDMLQWQNALNQDLLLQPHNSIKAFTRHKLDNGTEIEYGYGWHLKQIDGVPTREHGGSIFGFKSMAVYFPTEDLYVVGFTNCDCNSPTDLVRAIAQLSLEQLKNK